MKVIPPFIEVSTVKILLIEDDLEVCRYVSKGLKESGHTVDVANDGSTGLAFALELPFDVIVLDRMLPKLSGMEVLSQLRAHDISTPVLVLSAMGDVDDRVEGLMEGADDYLVKPYAFSELLARLTVLSRRATGVQPQARISVGPYDLDLTTQKLHHENGRMCELQPQETRLLEILMKNAGRVITRTMLLEYVWDIHFLPQSNVVDTQICRLRTKIAEASEASHSPIETVRGRGYRFHC